MIVGEGIIPCVFGGIVFGMILGMVIQRQFQRLNGRFDRNNNHHPHPPADPLIDPPSNDR